MQAGHESPALALHMQHPYLAAQEAGRFKNRQFAKGSLIMAAFDTSRPAQGFFGGRLSSLVASAVAMFVAWNDARVTRNALARLSDRELDDIGLCRGDIEAISARTR
jgi:uncharacterized protein YjiS (DUF1127 family)